MTYADIPSWNFQGVLPPIDINNPVSRERSPYAASLDVFVQRFGISSQRISILNGLLSFRSALHEAGLIKGFQWLDGSFLENVESLELRPPNDVDVVTYFYLPEGHTQETFFQNYPQLFDLHHNKTTYHVDAYFTVLNGSIPELLISDCAYWYSVWSHRRNALWKGYLEIDLSQTEDHIARERLNRVMSQGDTP